MLGHALHMKAIHGGTLKDAVLHTEYSNIKSEKGFQAAEEFYDKTATPYICTGIAVRAKKLIKDGHFPGVKSVEVVTKEGTLDTDYANEVEFEDGSKVIIDWHSNLDSDDPVVNDDTKGWDVQPDSSLPKLNDDKN